MGATKTLAPDAVLEQLHLQSVRQGSHLTSVRFDSNSYLMGVDGHALYCMENCTDQFDGDLKLVEGDHQVDGIG